MIGVETKGIAQMEWEEIAGNWILLPRRPIAVIHFLGGAFVSTAPHLTYRWLLEQLAKQNYVIIATPFASAFDRNAFDHSAIARSTVLRLESALEYLRQYRLGGAALPIYGLGHSLGCKLHLLNSSLFNVERAGNMLMAFNNYPAKRAIPLYEQVSQASSLLDTAVVETRQLLDQTLDHAKTPNRFFNPNQKAALSSFFNRVTEKVTQAIPPDIAQDISQKVSDQLSQLTPDLEAEFSPSPEDTQQLIAEHYGVAQNLLIQFQADDIDQTPALHQTLTHQFANQVTLAQLPGNHLTPLGQDVSWPVGRDFSPLDAVGQFVKQGAYQELNQLRSSLLNWLSK